MKIVVACFLFVLSLSVAETPNVLFFLVDDMGIADSSVQFLYEDGKPVKMPLNDRYRTPNMEKLAKNGCLFTNAYSYSVCSPTRISLMTGQAAARHAVTTWTHPAKTTIDTGLVKTKTIKSPPQWNKVGLNRELPLLPRLMKDAGYRTLFAGKAHFGPDDSPNGDPLNLGFDVNIAGYGGGGPGGYHGKHNYSAAWRGGGRQWDIPGLEKYHGTETFLSEAITLEMNQAIADSVAQKKPFFAYMSHYAVHAPFEVDDRFKANYPKLKGKDLAFATLVEGMDKSLGDMVAQLEKLGVAEETLIIFYSDNGSAGPLNKPIRGMKGHRHEGGFKVPLIVAWAKPNADNALQKNLQIEAGSVEHDIVTCVDMMPTMLKVAGAKIPEGAVIDGHDLRPYFEGKEGTHRPQEFLSHFPHRHSNTLFSTYRQKDWKIIYNYGSESWEMYNLKDDPYEKNNLAKKQPELARTMGMKLIKKLDAEGAMYPVDLKTEKEAKPNLDRI